jgi:hypothetical protein
MPQQTRSIAILAITLACQYGLTACASVNDIRPKPDMTTQRAAESAAPKEATVTETQVVFWHPEKPILLEREEYGRRDGDGDHLVLDVHEVEIRLGPLEHETYTVILRLRTNREFVDECLVRWRFGISEYEFAAMQVPWDNDRDFEMELHVERLGSEPSYLWINLSNLRHDSPPGTEFEPAKAIIQALAGEGKRTLGSVFDFEMRSIRQTRPDGTMIGFDYLDRKARRDADRARSNPTPGN